MNIRNLQDRLAALSFDPGPADGIIGPRTRAAIRAFQAGNGLVADGIAGPQTWAVLERMPLPEPDKRAMMLPDGAAAGAAAGAAIAIADTARPINEIIWHCAATPEGRDYTVDDIRAWHRSRGWSDIGYHYVVYRDGTIVPGRPIGQTGAHVAGRNAGTVGCCYVGGVSADGRTARDTRTDAQRSSMLALTQALAAKFPIERISGHNEFAAKACPSFPVPDDQLGNIAGFVRGRRR